MNTNTRDPKNFVLTIDREILLGPPTDARRESNFLLAREEDFAAEGALFTYCPKDMILNAEEAPEYAIPLPLRLPDGRCLRVIRRRSGFRDREDLYIEYPYPFEGAWKDDVESLKGLYTYKPLSGPETILPLRTEDGLVLMVDRKAWFEWNERRMWSVEYEIATVGDIGRRGMVFSYQRESDVACLAPSDPDPRAILPLELPDGRELLRGSNALSSQIRADARTPGVYDYPIAGFTGILSLYGREFWEWLSHSPDTPYCYDRYDWEPDEAARERAFRAKHPLELSFGGERPWEKDWVPARPSDGEVN